MKPNLLFIFTDQQRADTMACYGNTHVQAPNLNALADQSFVFDNAYVTQPVCTPDRSTIMTGLYPHTNGCVGNNVRLNPDVQTLAEMVSDDYATAYMGKWHLGNEVIAQHGSRSGCRSKTTIGSTIPRTSTSRRSAPIIISW